MYYIFSFRVSLFMLIFVLINSLAGLFWPLNILIKATIQMKNITLYGVVDGFVEEKAHTTTIYEIEKRTVCLVTVIQASWHLRNPTYCIIMSSRTSLASPSQPSWLYRMNKLLSSIIIQHRFDMDLFLISLTYAHTHRHTDTHTANIITLGLHWNSICSRLIWPPFVA